MTETEQKGNEPANSRQEDTDIRRKTGVANTNAQGIPRGRLFARNLCGGRN